MLLLLGLVTSKPKALGILAGSDRGNETVCVGVIETSAPDAAL